MAADKTKQKVRGVNGALRWSHNHKNLSCWVDVSTFDEVKRRSASIGLNTTAYLQTILAIDLLGPPYSREELSLVRLPPVKNANHHRSKRK